MNTIGNTVAIAFLITLFILLPYSVKVLQSKWQSSFLSTLAYPQFRFILSNPSHTVNLSSSFYHGFCLSELNSITQLGYQSSSILLTWPDTPFPHSFRTGSFFKAVLIKLFQILFTLSCPLILLRCLCPDPATNLDYSLQCPKSLCGQSLNACASVK